MSQHPIFHRPLIAAILAGAAVSALFVPQSASAIGYMSGLGGRGMSHSTFGGTGGSASHTSFRGPSIRHPSETRQPHHPFHIGDRRPGPLPPIRITLPPHHRLPPIFIPPYHRGPHLPPRIIVQAPPRIIPVSVGGSDIAPRVRTLRTDAPTCVADGSFVSVVFVPSVTAADITAFLKAYNVTMADGPNADGIYRIRIASGVLPQNDVLKLIDSMRTQTAIVSSVDGA